MPLHRKANNINDLAVLDGWGGIEEEGGAVVRISGSIWLYTVTRPVFWGAVFLTSLCKKIRNQKFENRKY